VAGEFAALQAKFSRVADALGPAGSKAALTDVGVQAKKDLQNEAEHAVGGDLRYSGWKRMGALKSGFEVEGMSVVMNPRPAGGWLVAEHGRKPTQAPKRRGRVRMKTPWGPRTFTKSEPMGIGRTSAKHSLTKATERIQKSSPQRYDEAVQKQLKEVFSVG
jgi:hypothetical protein